MNCHPWKEIPPYCIYTSMQDICTAKIELLHNKRIVARIQNYNLIGHKGCYYDKRYYNQLSCPISHY